MGHKVCCVLCRRSKETKVTGPLSTKNDVTAHQNCLLFSSGIFCQDSPLFDELFGFSVNDVLAEVKRGKLLKCHRCKKSGATAGCEVSRCKKSYHYPCAVEEGARVVEDTQVGKYGLFCLKHRETQNSSSSAKGHNPPLSKPSTSKNDIEAGPLKVYCLACDKKEENISLESLSNNIKLVYYDKHVPLSYKKNTNGESSGAGTSAHHSDSNSSSSSKGFSLKRRYSSDSSEGVSPTKRTSKSRTISEDSSHSDENQPDSELAPLEFDGDESINFLPESDHNRKDAEDEPTSGNQHQDESKDENDNDDTFVESDCESESLLLPVTVCVESASLSTPTAELSTQTHLTMAEVVKKERTGSQSEPSPVHDPDQKTNETSDPHHGPAASPPSSDHSEPHSVAASPPYICPDLSPPVPEPFDCSTSPPTPSPRGLQSPSASGTDSASFWRSCNTACCTQTVFTAFIKEMNDICGRIQSEEASQEDYDRALAVMKASGKLEDIVTKLQEEMERKQAELEKASRAMKEVVSALRR